MTGPNHGMLQCDHEEVDTCVVLHLQDGLKNGSAKCLLCTVDTDVVVILLEKFYHFRNMCPAADIWVVCGVGKKFTYIYLNATAQALGKDKCVALPTFQFCWL